MEFLTERFPDAGEPIPTLFVSWKVVPFDRVRKFRLIEGARAERREQDSVSVAVGRSEVLVLKVSVRLKTIARRFVAGRRADRNVRRRRRRQGNGA